MMASSSAASAGAVCAISDEGNIASKAAPQSIALRERLRD
jgi:hypothetical protein